MSVETTEQAIAMVKRWMDDRKVFKKDLTTDEVHFQYEGISDNGTNFSIQQPKEMARVVGVLSRMDFDPQHLEAFAVLDQSKRDEFLRDLIKGFTFLSPIFGFGPNIGKPEWVLFIKEISYDELTEGRLIEAVNQVDHAIVWTSLMFIEKFGEPKKE